MIDYRKKTDIRVRREYIDGHSVCLAVPVTKAGQAAVDAARAAGEVAEIDLAGTHAIAVVSPAFEARLTGLVVGGEPAPYVRPQKEVVRFSDRPRNRGRSGWLVIVSPEGKLAPFEGKTIPGLAVVLSENYERAGKWSGTDYTVRVAHGARSIELEEEFDTRRIIPGETWRTAAAVLRVSEAELRRFAASQRWLAKDRARLDEVEAALKTLEAPAQAQELRRHSDAEANRRSQPVGWWPPAAKPRRVIVTRHNGLVEWLHQHGIAGEVIPHATPEQVRGCVVYGILPLHLAAEATEVWVVDLPALKPEQRGQDLTPAEMDAAGARLTGYTVSRIG